jgi:hypothetical protein
MTKKRKWNVAVVTIVVWGGKGEIECFSKESEAASFSVSRRGKDDKRSKGIEREIKKRR